jgi:hypothetical protein
MPNLPTIRRLALTGMLLCCASAASAAASEDVLTLSVQGYFTNLFARLSQAAAQQPTEATFRTVMRPLVDDLPGLYGASLIDTNWTIRQTYFRRHFLAEGFDLKKVRELDRFRELMDRQPAAQLSEPGRGGLTQPHLISLRYPVMRDGRLAAIVSLMVRTEDFLRAAGLDNCRAYRVTCQGQVTETRGELTPARRTVKLELPSTEWVIDYE